MKKYIRLIVVGIALCTSGTSQSPPTVSGIEWSSLKPEGEIFTVELPAKISKDLTMDKAHGKYWTSIDGDYFMIFSEKSEKLGDIRSALGYIRSYQQQGETLRIGSLETERFDFKDEDGFYHSAISFNVGQKTYLFHAISRKSDDTMVKRFLGSLRVNGVRTEFLAEPEKSNDLPAEVNAPQGKNGQTGGYGSGTSTKSSGLGNGTTTSPPISLPPTTPLKLLSKPRALYTDLARLYEIQGIARVKVALLSTGEIGLITPVTHLPFGLTANAVAAAKKIVFEPRRVNGVPVSSIVTVEYSFTIY